MSLNLIRDTWDDGVYERFVKMDRALAGLSDTFEEANMMKESASEDRAAEEEGAALLDEPWTPEQLEAEAAKLTDALAAYESAASAVCAALDRRCGALVKELANLRALAER